MSRRSWGSSFLAILRRQGVKIDKETELMIEAEKDRDPEATTIDIVERLSLAPPEVIQQAKIVAQESGSTDMFAERVRQARKTVESTRNASVALSQIATRISRKA